MFSATFKKIEPGVKRKSLRIKNLLKTFAKVTRTALQNAASIAGLMLTTEAMIATRPKKKAAAAWEWECNLISDFKIRIADFQLLRGFVQFRAKPFLNAFVR